MSNQWNAAEYDAKHAFMNEMRPEVYDSACANLAWDRTLGFLKKALQESVARSA